MFDSDTAIFAIRQNSKSVAERLNHVIRDEACISIVTRAEILFGLKKLPVESKLHDRAWRFLEEFQALAWDEAAAREYAEVRFDLERQGMKIGTPDMMIAAHAISTGSILVTNNLRHFERIGEKLRIENWHQR